MILKFESHRGEILKVLAKKKKDQLLRAASVEGRNSTRVDKGKKRAERTLLEIKIKATKARTLAGRGGKSLLCDPGFGLRPLVGGREKRRAKRVHGMGKKRKKNVIRTQDGPKNHASAYVYTRHSALTTIFYRNHSKE